METKYLPKTKNKKSWAVEHLCQPTDYLRNKYYAYLKHRAQARHRREDYTLTWDDWHEIWCEEAWAQRGRGAHAQVLGRLDWDIGWHSTNVCVMSRREHFEIRQKFYAKP
tara:strand:- start:338 stop:667 length:330 start_codon:yes stop_codon:yes gene_type:complete